MEGGKVKEGYMIFAASPADETGISDAKEFISKNELTSEDVKLGRIGNSIVVLTRKEIELKK